MNLRLSFTKRQNCFVNLYFNSCSSNIKTGCVVKIKSVSNENELYSIVSAVLLNQNDDFLEINGLLGFHNNFQHDEEIFVEEIRHNLVSCQHVTINPYSNDDWHYINTLSKELEEEILKQVNVIQAGFIFPIWINNLCILFRINSFDLSQEYCLIRDSTEFNISPNPYITSDSKNDNHESEKLEAKNEIMNKSKINLLYTFFDFIHFLIYGKSIKGRKVEISIIKRWTEKFGKSRPDIKLNGRCYKPKCDDFRSIIQVYSSTEIVKNDELLLGKFTKSVDESIISFYKFKNFDGKNYSKTRFYIPSHIWNNLSLKVGDRLQCEMHDYRNYGSIHTLILTVPSNVNKEDLRKLKDSFLSQIGTIDKPLLIRNNMQLKLSFDTTRFIPAHLTIHGSNTQSKQCSSNKTDKESKPEEDVYYLMCEKLFCLWNIELKIHVDPKFNWMCKVDPVIDDWILQNMMTKQILNVLSIKQENGHITEPDNNIIKCVLLTGQSGSGKTYWCRKFMDFIGSNNSFQFYSVFIECRELIGLQLETIKTKLTTTIFDCNVRSPSVLVLDNLDKLAPSTQNMDEASNVQFKQIQDTALGIKYILETLKKLVKLDELVVIATAESDISLSQLITDSLVFDWVFRITESIFSTIVLEKIDTLMETAGLLKQDATLFLQQKSKLFPTLNGYDAVKFANQIQLEVSQASHRSVMKINEKYAEIQPITPINLDSLFRRCFLSNCSSSSSRFFQPVVTYRFKDIYGMEDVKRCLTETFIWPFKYPKIFANCPIKLQRGFLLYGLPGSGKSVLGMALANELGINYKFIKGPELLNKFIGSSEESIRNLFTELRQNQPSLVFFDEFDALGPKRGHDSTGVTDRVVNQLLTELDGTNSDSNTGFVLVLAATNRPDLLDPAILRPGRISGRGLCHSPTSTEHQKEALQFFFSQYQDNDRNLVGIDQLILYIKERCFLHPLIGYSSADLKSIVDETVKLAQLRHLNRSHELETTEEENKDENSVTVSIDDFERAIQCSRTSLTPIQIEQYNDGFELLDVGKRKRTVSMGKSRATLA